MTSISSIIWEKEVSLASYSTYKIGGFAQLFTQVTDVAQLKEAILFCSTQKIPFYILGRGSNTLFDDRGFAGAVILNSIDFINIEDHQVYAGSGVSFPKLGLQTAKLKLSGLEYAAGVPGTLGGAIFMNAGAHGQEIAGLIKEVEFIDLKGQVHFFKKEDLTFKYRWSCFHLMKGAIASARLELKSQSNTREHQKEILSKRQSSQPLKAPSCGCVFRNFEDISAGALIDQLGLKGKQIGGAQISEIHANFIVNVKDARAKDVLALVSLIEETVYQKTGRHMVREIRYIPYQSNL